jgi:hypothetical protein
MITSLTDLAARTGDDVGDRVGDVLRFEPLDLVEGGALRADSPAGDQGETAAASCASARAGASPIPLLEPVTSATVPPRVSAIQNTCRPLRVTPNPSRPRPGPISSSRAVNHLSGDESSALHAPVCGSRLDVAWPRELRPRRACGARLLQESSGLLRRPSFFFRRSGK